MTSSILTNLECFSFLSVIMTKKMSFWPWNYLHRDKWDSDGTAMDLLSELTFAGRRRDQTGHRKGELATSSSAVYWGSGVLMQPTVVNWVRGQGIKQTERTHAPRWHHLLLRYGRFRKRIAFFPLFLFCEEPERQIVWLLPSHDGPKDLVMALDKSVLLRRGF